MARLVVPFPPPLTAWWTDRRSRNVTTIVCALKQTSRFPPGTVSVRKAAFQTCTESTLRAAATALHSTATARGTANTSINVGLARGSGQFVDPRRRQHAAVVMNPLRTAVDEHCFRPDGEYEVLSSK